jgi:membrane protein implicated in regulation of membrane protease activity
MTWANFYLVCFLVGFLLSLLSLLLGSLHINFHLPHAGGHGFHFHLGDGAAHVAAHAAGHAVHGVGHAVHGPGQPAPEAALSPLNFGTIAAFLAWFGGSGYLLARYSGFWSLVGLTIAVLFGTVGAALVFAFLAKLAEREENLDPGDYDMVGVLGRISSGIRAGGTGEIIYSQEGTRRTSGARSDDGREMPKGTEVVVTRYEKGLAYVRRWEDLAGDAGGEKGQ